MRRVFWGAAAGVIGVGLPMPVQAQGAQIVVPPTQQGTLLCKTGDTLLLGGPDTLRDFYMCTLSADRQEVSGQQQMSNPNYPYYAFRWTAQAAGTHRLTLDYVLENRTKTNGRRLLVLAQEAAPAVLSALPARFYGAAGGKDLPVTVQLAPGFRASRVDLFLDGVPAGSLTAGPYAFSLPLGGVLTGPHAAFIEATDASGDVYISPVQRVEVMGGNAPGTAGIGAAGGTAGAGQAGHSAARPKKPARPPKHRHG